MNLTQSEIEAIISEEVEVDCYHEDEAAMSWYYYLTDGLSFPFEAEYLRKKRNGETDWIKVEVVGKYVDEGNFNGKAFYVEIGVNDLLIPVRLSELRNLVMSDEEEEEVIQVWRYHVKHRSI